MDFGRWQDGGGVDGYVKITSDSPEVHFGESLASFTTQEKYLREFLEDGCLELSPAKSWE